MFGLGMGELLVIFVIVLIVLGPTKLPQMATSLGKALREFRKATYDIKQEISKDGDLAAPLKELEEAVTLHPEEIRRREARKAQLAAAGSAPETRPIPPAATGPVPSLPPAEGPVPEERFVPPNLAAARAEKPTEARPAEAEATGSEPAPVPRDA